MAICSRIRGESTPIHGIGGQGLRTPAAEIIEDGLEQTRGARNAATLEEGIRQFAEYHDYYDVFFIGPEGDVLYTVAKEDDYRTNLVSGDEMILKRVEMASGTDTPQSKGVS